MLVHGVAPYVVGPSVVCLLSALCYSLGFKMGQKDVAVNLNDLEVIYAEVVNIKTVIKQLKNDLIEFDEANQKLLKDLISD